MALKIRIKRKGLYGANGSAIPVGATFTVKEVPASMKHHIEVIGEGDTPLTNEAQTSTIPSDEDLEGYTREKLAAYIVSTGGEADANDAKPKLLAAAKEAAATLRA